MYAWIFRHLPGPLWFRVTLAAAVIVTVVLLLMNLVFPWLSQYSPWTESTIGLMLL